MVGAMIFLKLYSKETEIGLSKILFDFNKDRAVVINMYNTACRRLQRMR